MFFSALGKTHSLRSLEIRKIPANRKEGASHLFSKRALAQDLCGIACDYCPGSDIF